MLPARGRLGLHQQHTPLVRQQQNRPGPGGGQPIRVLAVDDSKFFLGALRRALSAIPNVRVVGTAANGREAIEAIVRLKPDLLTLDLEMPEMDGLETLKKIQLRKLDVRVVMVSAHTSAGAEKTLEALELGAEDFITKPSSSVSGDKVEYLKQQLNPVLATFRKARPSSRPVQRVVSIQPQAPRRQARSAARDIVLIAVSTGGPRALSEFMKTVPPTFAGTILIAQHMPALFTQTLAERLDRLTHLKVTEGVNGEPVLPGRVYVAPGGFHMEVTSDKGSSVLKVHDGPRLHGCRPAAASG